MQEALLPGRATSFPLESMHMMVNNGIVSKLSIDVIGLFMMQPR